MAREPKRSTIRPAGICAETYTATWMKTNMARAPGLIWNRSAASSPATPSVVRCITVST